MPIRVFLFIVTGDFFVNGNITNCRISTFLETWSILEKMRTYYEQNLAALTKIPAFRPLAVFIIVWGKIIEFIGIHTAEYFFFPAIPKELIKEK